LITVVHIITQLEMGGAQENTLDTCERLDRARFRVALLHGPDGHYDARAQAMADARVEVVPELVRRVSPREDGGALISIERRITSMLEEHKSLGFDPHAFIVHTHSSKAGILGRFAARAARAPIVVHTIHGFGFFEGQNPAAKAAFIGMELAASHVTDAFISVSRACLAEAQARGIARQTHRTAVIRSGFPLAPLMGLDAKRVAARRSLGLTDQDEALVAIANLKPQKDPLTLVHAMRILADRRPRAVLLYAGDGELRAVVEAEIARAELNERFRLLGWREDVPELLAASDAVVLSSLYEGLPRSAVQAIAARRPFVGTRVDGTAEIIREGRNGFLVEPRSPIPLARAMERALIERPIDRDDVERIKEWDVDAMVRAEERLYAELAGRRPWTRERRVE
jgi:glycosyltransferase involved in cell wall biosynthesis